jgi:hypothetical protein
MRLRNIIHKVHWQRCLIFGLIISIAACSPPPPPPPPENIAPTSSIATIVPFSTLLPTVTTNAVIPSITPEAVAVQPTATRSSAQSTRPSAGKFSAPAPIAPSAPALFKDGNDIQFKYASVGKLEPNQCYLLHIELAVPNLPKGNRGDDFLDIASCGDQGPAGKELTFVLYRGKFINSPNYGTILTQTHELAPEARLLKMTWFVRVVQNNGRAADGVHYNTVALSPNSAIREFDFQP